MDANGAVSTVIDSATGNQNGPGGMDLRSGAKMIFPGPGNGNEPGIYGAMGIVEDVNGDIAILETYSGRVRALGLENRLDGLPTEQDLGEISFVVEASDGPNYSTQTISVNVITVEQAAINTILEAAGAENVIAATDLETAGAADVEVANEASYQAEIAALTAEELDTVEEIQAMVSRVNAIAAIAAAAGAENEVSTDDLVTAGMEGVEAANEADYQAAIAALSSEDLDTGEKIQTLVDEVNARVDALAAIGEFSVMGTEAPTAADYADAGIIGIDTDLAVSQLNEAIASSDPADVDTVEEIQALADSVLDADEDGIPDLVEGTGDFDSDQLLDSADLDSDNDGIPDSVEAGVDPSNPVDSDGDLQPDYVDYDADGDGIPDAIEAPVGISPSDTDLDDIPDYLDLDSDGDGVPDALEDETRTGLDENQNGIDDGYEAQDVAAGKSLGNKVDEDNNGIEDGITRSDFDNDDVPDMMDVDSDNDGLTDGLEAGVSGNDSDGDGIDDIYDVTNTMGTDDNNDGIDDAVQVKNTDGSGKPDYKDLDSDDDSIPDITETGGTDTDNDGQLDEGADLTNNPTDSDGDGTPDSQEVDSDGDGTNDIEGTENAGTDADGDGQVDDVTDADGDGIPDAADGNVGGFGGPEPETIVESNSVNNLQSNSESSIFGGGASLPWLLMLVMLQLVRRFRI